jgi:hypothetical protein
MPMIEIDEGVFKRLQAIAIPFVDTPSLTIKRLLDQAENKDSTSAAICAPVPAFAGVFSEPNLPPLVHVRLLRAEFGTHEPTKVNWDSLVQLALSKVNSNVKTARELHAASGANVVDGAKSDDGYKYIEKEGFSYQGVSAQEAVRIVASCSRFLKIKTRIEFEWRVKAGAFRPGERAIISVGV